MIERAVRKHHAGGLKITRLYPKMTMAEKLEGWLNVFIDKIQRKNKNHQEVTAEKTSVIKGLIKEEIEEIFEKARQVNLDRETFEIYENISKVLLNIRQEQELFPFEDTILAWEKALETCGTEKEKIPKILLGIILATLYERNKKKEVSKK